MSALRSGRCARWWSSLRARGASSAGARCAGHKPRGAGPQERDGAGPREPSPSAETHRRDRVEAKWIYLKTPSRTYSRCFVPAVTFSPEMMHKGSESSSFPVIKVVRTQRRRRASKVRLARAGGANVWCWLHSVSFLVVSASWGGGGDRRPVLPAPCVPALGACGRCEETRE